ncbi:hypothetical protein VNO80_06419 [Phaseolus coccineus]|uniref:Uncharacterized protein n=1 Tax=Phaseolus coccineus TaxID=3886 RepID=A0AAN9RIQ0_PHACN
MHGLCAKTMYMGKKTRDDIGRVKMKIDWLELVDEGQGPYSCLLVPNAGNKLDNDSFCLFLSLCVWALLNGGVGQLQDTVTEREQKTRRENGSDKSISRDQKKQGHPFELN